MMGSLYICVSISHIFHHSLPCPLYSSHTKLMTVLFIYKLFNTSVLFHAAPSFWKTFVLLPLAVNTALTHFSSQSSPISLLEKTWLLHSFFPAAPLPLTCVHRSTPELAQEIGCFLCSTGTPKEQELCWHFSSSCLAWCWYEIGTKNIFNKWLNSFSNSHPPTRRMV